MKSIWVCGCLTFCTILLLLEGNSVDAWNRQIFNRYSRNLLTRNGRGTGAGTTGKNLVSSLGQFGAAELDMPNNVYHDYGTLAGLGNAIRMRQQTQPHAVLTQSEPEVYGIVEPLIEDTPCADRACNLNSDCCPTGVCVNTYGEGKCVYVFGRQQDMCQHNGDCESGAICANDFVSGIWMCKKDTALQSSFELKQFGDECVTSADCAVAKGMCCQLIRSHHRIFAKKLCSYLHDPFDCIDIIRDREKEELRDGHFLTTFGRVQRM